MMDKVSSIMLVSALIAFSNTSLALAANGLYRRSGYVIHSWAKTALYAIKATAPDWDGIKNVIASWA